MEMQVIIRKNSITFLCFYKQVLLQNWDGRITLQHIDVQYKGQIVGIRRDANGNKMDSLRAIQIMKAAIADAQKHVNDSTIIQQPDEPDDDNINISKEVDITPDENIKDNKKVTKTFVPVTPVHVPEKPSIEHHAPEEKNVLTSHSSSFEKPNLTSSKVKIVNPAISKPDGKIKQQPKAVMPSKTDY